MLLMASMDDLSLAIDFRRGQYIVDQPICTGRALSRKGTTIHLEVEVGPHSSTLTLQIDDVPVGVIYRGHSREPVEVGLWCTIVGNMPGSTLLFLRS